MAELVSFRTWALEEFFASELVKPAIRQIEPYVVKRGTAYYSWDILSPSHLNSLWSLDKENLKMMKRLAKSKQFDVYKSTPELNMPEEKTIKSSSGSTGGPSSTDEDEMSRLEGKVTREVVLPDGRHVSLDIEAKTPMMDVLIQISSQHGFLPGGKCIRVPSDRPPGFLHYKPNTPIGKIDCEVLQIVEKAEIFDLPKKVSPKTANLPFEPTVRVQVDLPRNQKTFIRVARQTTLEEIYQQICVENSFHPALHQFRHSSNLSTPLEMSRKLSEFSVCNFAVITSSSDVRKSTGDIFGVLSRSQDGSKEEKPKNKGILGLFKKKKKETTMSAMVTDTVEVERRSGSSSFKTRPVSVAGDVVLRHTSVDIDRSAKTVTTGPSVGSGADLPPKPPTRAKKQPAPKPPAETAVADSKTKQLPLSSFAVDSTPLAINGVETKNVVDRDEAKTVQLNNSGDLKLSDSLDKRKSKAPPPPEIVESSQITLPTVQTVEAIRHVRVTNIDEIQLEPIHSVAEQKDSNSSVPNGHQHDDSGSAAEDHYDVEQHFGEVIAAGQEQLLEESVNNSKKESESSQLSPDKDVERQESAASIAPMSINSEVINDSEVTVSSSIKTSTPTHSEFKEEFREIGIPEDKLPQIFKLESRVSLKDINWGRQSSVSANVETLASSASGVVEVAEEPNSKNNEPVQMDPKFRSEIQVSLSPRKLDEAKTANLPEKKIQALSKPVEELIQILKYDGGLEGVLKSVNTASDQAVKPRDIPTPGIMFKDPIQPDSGRGSNSSASLPPMTVKVYQGEPPIQPLRSSSVCSTLSSESSRPDRQSPLQISTEESLHYSPCPSSMGTSKSDEQSAYNNSRTNTPPKLTSPALIIRDSQKDRFPTMQVKSFEDEYYVRSREGDEFLKTNKYGVLPPAESTSSIHSGTSSGRSAKSPVFMIAGFKSTTESIGYDEEKVQKKQVGTAVEVRSSGNKPAHNGKATVPVNSTPVGPMIGRQEYSSSIRHESTVKPQLSNDDLKLQQEYDKLHKLFTAWQRQLKTNEQLVKQGGKVPEVSLLDFQRLQAQMLAQHEFVQSLCNDAQTTSGSVKSGSLQSVSSGSLNSLSSSPVGEIIMESRTCQVTIAQEQEDPTKVIERQLIAETFAVRNFSKSRSGGVSPEKEPPKPVTTTTDLNGPGSIQKIIAERRATRLANQESSATYQLNANNSVLNGVVSEIDKSSVIRPSQLFKKKSTAEVVTNGHGTNGFAQPMPFTNVVKYDEVPTRSTLPGNRQRSQLPTDSEVVGDTVKQSVLPSVSKLAGVFCSSNDNTQPQNFRQSQNGPTWQQLNCITPNSSTTGGTKPLGWSERQLEQTTFKTSQTVVGGNSHQSIELSGYSSNGAATDRFAPPPPPPPPLVIGEFPKASAEQRVVKSAVKKDVRFKDLPTTDPREDLLSAIKDFGGSHGLRKTAGLTRVN